MVIVNTKVPIIVPPEGPLDAKIVIVGECPGTTETIKRKPFCGSSGDLLNRLLHQVGISRVECYTTNVIKEQPVDNDVGHFIQLQRGVKETAAYQKYEKEFLEELSQLQPNVVIALGNVALYALTKKVGITKWRGSILEGPNGTKVIPTIHPAAALRQYLFTHYMLSDLKRVKEESESKEIKLPERNFILHPSFSDCLAFLQKMKEGKKMVAFDIEVVNLEVSCISFCNTPDETICIPFVEDGHDYFTPDQEADIWKVIADLLEDPEVPKLGQNVIFDSGFLFRKYGITVIGKDDTMVGQAYIAPELPKGLDFICSIYTREPFYKDDGKRWFKLGGTDYRTFWSYNAKDSAVCLEAYSTILRDVKRLGNEEAYKRQIRLIEPLLFMMERGVRVDVEGMKKASEDAEVKINELTARLQKKVGYAINPASPKQLSEFFYNKKGYKPYVNHKTGGISTDEKALKRLVGKGSEEAKLIMEIRKLAKMKGTYFDVRVDEDNRLRCSFNPVGTVSGRISSSKTIFDTGGNMQNIPAEVKKYLLADEGYLMYNLDLSQAENRCVAYIAPELNMIRAFEEGIDIHKQTASLIFGKPMDEISTDEDVEEDPDRAARIGGGTQSERFWGKKANHSQLGSDEVLTRKGWVRLDQFDWKNDEMMQWWNDGRLNFTKPVAMFHVPYSGDMYRFTNTFIHQFVTPDHRLPFFNHENGKFKIEYAKDFRCTSRWRLPVAGNYDRTESILTPDELRFIAAIQADGSIHGSGINLRVAKQRKIDRGVWIAERLGLKYTLTKGGLYFSEYNPLVKRVKELIGKEKLFGPWLLECSRDALSAFVQELPKWDGHQKRWQYFTTVEENAKWVQIASSLVGVKCTYHIRENVHGFGTKPLHWVRFATGNTTSCMSIARNKEVVENIDIYCPTVESGFFLVRSEGKVSVTGNSLNYDFGAKSFAMLYEIPENDAKWLVERYHQAYPGVRQYHAWIRQKLSQDRILEDCYGRKRMFLDRWGDDLFKEAYSFIPQGTVATKINLEGLLFLYENKESFKEVELLNQVHDSITFQIPLNISWTRHAEILVALRDSLQQPILWKTTSFSIPADCKAGFNMHDMSKVAWNKYKTVESLAKFLEDSFTAKGD